MLTTAWDDTKLNDTEITIMEAKHKEHRSELPRGLRRVNIWYLDRVFFKAVRDGETPNDAREKAIGSLATVKGFLAGVFLMLAVATGVTAVLGAAQASDSFGIVFNTIVWTVIVIIWVLVLTGWVRRIFRRRK